MRAFFSVRFVSCWFALALGASADTPAANTGLVPKAKPGEARQLAADLKFMQGQRTALDEKRQALEAELAKVRMSGDTKRAAELPKSIEMMRRKVETVDRMILATNDRLKTLGVPDAPASGSKAGPAQPAKKKTAGTASAPKPMSAAAKQKIDATARQLSQNPNPSMAATRSAASEMIAANPVDFSGMSIEDAVVLLFMLMAEDARDDMREMLVEMDAKRTGGQPPRDPIKKKPGAKSETAGNDMSGADQRQIAELQNRKVKLEQLLSEATKKRADTSGDILENPK